MALIQKEVKKVYKGSTQVWPKLKTFTISWTEQSNMSSGWTYSDDATWLTAWDTAFDEFFWYSAVRLNTSWQETAEVTQEQSGWAGKLDITQLWTLTSWDNVMIKFPVRWIKMTKNWSVVTLSITEEPNKAWYQYYAHTSSWTLDNPWTPKDAFYLWAYKWSNSSSVLKSWSWQSSAVNNHPIGFCTRAKANGSWYNIVGFYQRQYITALYMMKYGNPDSQSVIWKWYTSVVSTWGTNSQTNATYWTNSTSVQCKLFWLEDRWGSAYEFIWGARTDGSKQLCTSLSNWSWYSSSGWEWTWTILNVTPWYPCLSSISWNNKAMFTPQWTVNSTYVNIYYSSMSDSLGTNQIATTAWHINYGGGIFVIKFGVSNYTYDSYTGTRLMYLEWLS